MSGERVVRTVVVRCGDWPVVAAGVAPDVPGVVVVANRVVAATPAARAEGVADGQRRREAQARCPGLEVHEHDEGRDVRAFEDVVVAVGAFTPRLELTRPGRVSFPTRGPSRYFGGDEALGERLAHAVDVVLADRGWAGWARVGIADGPFAAELAARDPRARPVRVVPPGGSAAELAPRSVADLGRPDLADLLVRLGVATLGELAALDPADLLARFGEEGLLVHRLASGLDERPPATTPPSPELRVQAELDPPADRVDTAAFVAKALADDLHARLERESLWCTRVVVAAETDHEEVSERVWRHEGALDAGAIADRVRWQLDGWLNGSAAHRPTGGIVLLRLAPDEVVPARGRQLGFWGGEAGADERVVRAVARLEGILGAGAVTVPEWRGGRDPASRVVRVPAGAVELRPDRASARPAPHDPPWPGQVPDPAPALVHHPALPVEVLDEVGDPVRVSGRGLLSAVPAAVGSTPVVRWAGPWPADERWWDPGSRRRRARLQVLLEDGRALLLALEHGRWGVEATYD